MGSHDHEDIPAVTANIVLEVTLGILLDCGIMEIVFCSCRLVLEGGAIQSHFLQIVLRRLHTASYPLSSRPARYFLQLGREAREKERLACKIWSSSFVICRGVLSTVERPFFASLAHFVFHVISILLSFFLLTLGRNKSVLVGLACDECDTKLFQLLY